MENQDEKRYCYYELQFTKNCSNEKLEHLKEICTKNFEKEYGQISYVVAEDGGYHILAVVPGEEKWICSGHKVLKKQKMAIVEAGYEQLFQSYDMGLSYEVENSIMVYGCSPLMIGAIVSQNDVNADNTAINRFIIRFKTPLKWKERHLLMKKLKELDTGVEVNYWTKGKWLIHGIAFYKYMLVMILGVLLFTAISICSLIKYLYDIQRKELLVCIMCGADEKMLHKYLLLEELLLQIPAVILGYLASFVAINCFPIITISNNYVFPFVCICIVAAGCIGLTSLLESALVKKDVYACWRKME